MGLRFRKRVALLPGIRLNLSRSGLSASFGTRGAWYTVGPKGQRRVTVGAPGTGLSYTKTAHASKAPPGPADLEEHRSEFRGALWLVAIAVGLVWLAWLGLRLLLR